MDKTRIIIADDQALMRDGLKTILESEDSMEVMAMAEDGLKAYELAKSLKPDVVLMDIRMPVMDGVDSVRLIKKDVPEVKVIMLTTFDDDEYILEALSFGADGYLLKSIQAEKLIDCINNTISGIFTMNSDIASKIACNLSNIPLSQKNRIKIQLSDFTGRETEVAGLMADGYTNGEIAEVLNISEGTVKNYISVIYEKVGINDRVKAIALLKQVIEGQKGSNSD